jgi:hypothetical protein
MKPTRLAVGLRWPRARECLSSTTVPTRVNAPPPAVWSGARNMRTTGKQNVEPPAAAAVENAVESVYPRQCQMNLRHLKSIFLMRLI